MAAAVIKPFKEQGLFWQPPEAVGRIIVGIQSTPSIHGKAFYIEGGDGWEFEDSFYAYQPQWLGKSFDTFNIRAVAWRRERLFC